MPCEEWKLTGEQTYSGNPYRGLASFDVKHADLFVGREKLVDRAVDKLRSKAELRQPFLLVLGKSGAGKDSLMQAGIIPTLNKPETIPGVNQFLHAIIKPTDLVNDPIKGFIQSLTSSSCGEIFETAQVRQLTGLCKEQPEQFFALLQQKLDELPIGVRLILGVKQLECLFIGQAVGQVHRRFFSDLIARLVNELGIFVIVTMRSDYYQYLTDLPALLALKQQRGQLDIDPPNNAELLAMIQRPAMMSGVQFEVAKDGLPGLDFTLAERTEEFPDSLALLQFSLTRLYETQSQNNIINYAAYRKIGGLERAISNHAEFVYESLERSQRKHFTRTFTRLAQKSEVGGFERVWVVSDELLISDRAHHLVQAFLDSGLLVSESNADGIVTISLVHNCIIDHWSRLKECLESNQKLLRLKENMESQAQQWQTATRPSAYLLLPGKALEEGRLLLKHGGKLHPSIKALINASLKRVKRNRRILVLGALFFVVLLGFTVSKAFRAKVDTQVAEAKLEKSHELIEFLINDEHRQLEPMGLLDVMKESSERSYQYFTSVKSTQSSNAEKLSRSNTFFSIGKVQLETGNFDAALKSFEQAMTLNNELVEVNPNGYEFLTQLARTHYWIATTHFKAGDLDKAELNYLSYQKVAFDLVKLKPDSDMAKIELAHAYRSVASIAVARNQKERAMQLYLDAIKFASQGRASKKQDLELLIQAYSWLENKYKSEMKIKEALEMSQGELSVKNRLVVLDKNEQNSIAAAVSNWTAISNMMLVGQNKKASSSLQKLQAESAFMAEQYADNNVWKYLHAFSLSRLAQINFLAGRVDEAKEQFIESFIILEKPTEQADNFWFDAYFERQYWHIRMLYNLEQNTNSLDAENLIVGAEHEEASIWKIRLASLKNNKASIPEEKDLRNLNDPSSLIAYIEHAVQVADPTKVRLLRDLVPQEMWLYPDLASLRPQILQLLQE